MPEPTPSPNIAELSFEDAIKELEGIVRRLENGDTTLDQAIEDYTRGSQLRSHCEKQLNEARLKVEKITANSNDANGATVTTEPFEASE